MKNSKFLLLLLPLFFFSCSKEKYYEFQVINNTHYDITEFHLDWCQSDNRISIKSNQSSDKQTLLYETSAANAIASGSLCICVASFSDLKNPDSSFTNNCGISRGRDFFTTKEVNKIYIVADSEKATANCENNIFKYEYE